MFVVRSVNCFKIGVTLLILTCVLKVNGQNSVAVDVSFSIPEIALVDIEPGVNNTIYFEVDPAPESGTQPEIKDAVNETLWLNYTSSHSGSGFRRISVAISSGELPEGVAMYVQASPYTGVGNGLLGQNTAKKILGKENQVIVDGIQNCFTGDGVGNGHSIRYTLHLTDIEKVNSISNANFVVIYTLIDY